MQATGSRVYPVVTRGGSPLVHEVPRPTRSCTRCERCSDPAASHEDVAVKTYAGTPSLGIGGLIPNPLLSIARGKQVRLHYILQRQPAVLTSRVLSDVPREAVG